jgi:F-type H+-transporting ATPase subunit gamma
MPSRQIIGRRIRSVRNTRQITKAMQMVAASKLRRAQMAALGPQAYTAAARELLTNLSGQPVVKRHPLLQTRLVKRRLAIVIAGDRGLAGGYNHNVIRALVRAVKVTGSEYRVIAIGRRAAAALARARDVQELASFEVEAGDAVTEIAMPVLEQVARLFTAGEVDQVDLITTEFVSTVSQRVVTRQLLPVVIPPGSKPRGDAEMEPEPEDLVDAAIRRILCAELTQAVLDARAAEQAARMLAMMSATDNADDIIEDLTLMYNNARQAGITQQISEISAGAEAMVQA